jgi:KUP system potassium uptake protein
LQQANESASRRGLPVGLALAALGVVFGDIGTSPLYALRACLRAGGSMQVNSNSVLGVLSLIFWALALTITAKYLTIILRTDNRGEGGVLALTALVGMEGPRRYAGAVSVLGLAGCALFYGDGFITPAVTVLGAIEGLEIVAPGFVRIVVPLSIVALFGLFTMQRHGSGALGGLFGPVMLVWFLVLAALGIHGIAQHPEVIAAVNPWFAVNFFIAHSGVALLVAGSVFLAVTGGEALYADLGHFGATPIRLAWFCVAWPSLLLNYFGQGALLLSQPDAITNPFFRLAPPWFVVPLVLLATAAAIIASQAVISGVFSMTQQALQLGFLPRLRVVQSSAEAVGQVYVPAINWLLCVATILLVLSFGTADSLANAYGIAVASTMVIETSLLLTLLSGRSGRTDRLCLYFLIPLAAIDLGFFTANIAKIPQGGWLPLTAAASVFLLMRTWTRGRVIVSDQMRRQGRTEAQFLLRLEHEPPARVPGVAIFLTSESGGVPRTLVRNVQHNGVLHEHTVLLTIITERIPRIARGGRVSVSQFGPGLYRVEARVGFMDQPQVPKLLREAERRGLGFRTQDATYFLSRDDIVTGSPRGMQTWRKYLFLFLARNSQFAGAHFGIPRERIIEIGGQVEI